LQDSSNYRSGNPTNKLLAKRRRERVIAHWGTRGKIILMILAQRKNEIRREKRRLRTQGEGGRKEGVPKTTLK